MPTTTKPLTMRQLRARVLVSVPEAAAVLQCQPRLVRTLIENGELSSIRVSSLTRIHAKSLLDMLGDTHAAADR